MDFPRRDARDKLRGRTRYTIDRAARNAARGAAARRRAVGPHRAHRRRQGDARCPASALSSTAADAPGVTASASPTILCSRRTSSAMTASRSRRSPRSTLAQAQAAAAAIDRRARAVARRHNDGGRAGAGRPLGSSRLAGLRGSVRRRRARRQRRLGSDGGARRHRRRVSRAGRRRSSRAAFVSAGRTMSRSKPRAVVASYEDGRFHIETSTQVPWTIRNATARLLNVPASADPGHGAAGRRRFRPEIRLRARAFRGAAGARSRAAGAARQFAAGGDADLPVPRERRYPHPLGSDQRWRDRRPRSRRADGLRRLWRRADISDDHDRPHAGRQLSARRGQAGEPRHLHQYRAQRRVPRLQRRLQHLRARAAHRRDLRARSAWIRSRSAAATCWATAISAQPARCSKATCSGRCSTAWPNCGPRSRRSARSRRRASLRPRDDGRHLVRVRRTLRGDRQSQRRRQRHACHLGRRDRLGLDDAGVPQIVAATLGMRPRGRHRAHRRHGCGRLRRRRRRRPDDRVARRGEPRRRDGGAQEAARSRRRHAGGTPPKILCHAQRASRDRRREGLGATIAAVVAARAGTSVGPIVGQRLVQRSRASPRCPAAPPAISSTPSTFRCSPFTTAKSPSIARPAMSRC